MEDDTHPATVGKRQVKSTVKAMEDALQRKIGSRKAALGQLTAKKNEMLQLMDDDSNLEVVENKLTGEFNELFGEFCELNTSVRALFQQCTSEEDMNKDQQGWFEPKANTFKGFTEQVDRWIKDVLKRKEEAKKVDESVKPSDSISLAASKRSKGSKASHSSSSSSASSTRLKTEMERAALLAQAAALKQRQALEKEEAKIKAEKEELEIQTALAAADAKLKVLQRFEGSVFSHCESTHSVTKNNPPPIVSKGNGHGTDAQHVKKRKEQNAQSPSHLTDVGEVDDCSSSGSSFTRSGDRVCPNTLVTVMQRQNDITEFLAKQQRISTLPPQHIPTFMGDPLEYRLFIRAFEHGVESKTESNRDRLYFLEQYTSGQPQELVRSCLHMDQEQGYREAKNLLKEHFGNEYRISVAYINKALSWPTIKADDGEALNALALFLTSCSNAMTDTEYMEELDNIANMRVIVSKLPYKLKEKWRTVAFDLEEQKARRPKFKDLVKFVNTQAKVVLHPLFGDLKDNSKGEIKSSVNLSSGKKSGKKIFTTTVTPVETQFSVNKEQNFNKIGSSGSVSAFTKPCLFCKSEHNMAQCKRMRKSLHKEKLEFLRSKGLCFSCLKQGHMSKFCEEKLNCEVCSLTHPTVLHIKNKDKPIRNEETSEDDEKYHAMSGFVGTESKQYSGKGADDTDSILSIVPVQVKAKKGNKIVTTYAFLDPGSTATFCTVKLMNELNLHGKKTDILLTTMGQQRTVSSHIITGLEVSSLDDYNFIELPEVFSQMTIPANKRNIPQQEDVDKWPHLGKVQIPNIQAEIGLLIGTNVPKAMEPEEVIRSVNDGPYAVRTLLGWTVNGPLRENSCDASRNGAAYVNRISVAKLEDMWNQQLRYDFPECSQEEMEMSIEDLQFMDSVSQSARLIDGHYCIGLPLKDKRLKMPNNRVMAEQRAINLKKRLLKNPSFCADYIAFMSDMIVKGYAVKVPVKDVNRSDGKVWYIPHHGVYHPKKKKLRIVFDCGASYQGTTLNKQLLQGPNLTSTLIGVLTRFRCEPVAVMADVEAMFHQVFVPPEDADLLRFLWWPEGNISKDLVEYRMAVHLFGATSSPSCASYALRKCAEDNREFFDATVVNTVLHNFYVDDCLKSVSSEEEAVLLFHNLKALLQKGGFNLTKWTSNSRKTLAAIPVKDRAKEVKDLDLDQCTLPLERALGVQWSVQSDCFKFKITIQDKPPTRRNILSVVSSIYDPLGILAPVILSAKRILQELCRLKLSWDETVPVCYARQWSDWKESLQLLSGFEMDRCFKPAHFGGTTLAQLHHFCDASEDGYGTVTYLVQKNCDNQIHLAFVMGKARVAPLKHITIPRMELTAATMAVRIDRMLKGELQLQLADSVFWSDSMAVLKYINNETTRFRTFVANRVSEILTCSDVSQWRHVGTHLNPADFASRGQKVSSFVKNKAWIFGPDFLTKPADYWPRNLNHLNELNISDPELKKSATTNVLTVEGNKDIMEDLIRNHSSWVHLKRVVAWILKAKHALLLLAKRRKLNISDKEQQTQQLDKVMTSQKMSPNRLNLTVDELKEAELEIMRHCQRRTYGEEINALQNGEPVKRTSHIYKLNPVFQDGILRVGGRLSRTAMPEESKHPAIMDKNSRVSELILHAIHEEVGHSGRNHILSKLRQKYWIPGVSTAIKRVLSKCLVCRRLRGLTGQQKMADLPRSRVTPDEPPFTRTGVDYFGPFDVKRGRATVKRYGVIFTCLTIRAIHLEVAASLDTDSFINALRRFISRRGQVMELRSDNGTNFIGAERELKRAIQEWNISRIENTLTQKGIKWIFNPPTASHHGGVWERLIRSIRKILHTTLKTQRLDEEGLQTFLCEAEAIINSRPITTPSSDPNDLEALTPNHLLLLKSKPSLPPGLFQKEDLYARRRWRQVQYMADLFWKRWIREYLPELQRRQKWLRVSRNFVPGDIVLIADESAPRNSWIMGKIIQSVPDEHGLVRRVRVKTKTSELDRPITKICLLLEAE